MAADALAVFEGDVLLDGWLEATGVLFWAITLTVPELIATQSSWLYTVAPEITMLLLSEMSKPSVLCPPLFLSPARLSMVILVRVRLLQLLMLNT